MFQIEIDRLMFFKRKKNDNLLCKDKTIKMKIDPELSITGGEKIFVYDRFEICQVCLGKGTLKPSLITKCLCEYGTRLVPNNNKIMGGYEVHPCYDCRGEGVFFTEKCNNCNGDMTVKETKSFILQIKEGF